MAILTSDVINKDFTATQLRRGYDENEVDDFLDQIVIELRRLTTDNDELRGLIPPDALDKIAAARASAENAEMDAAARIAKANAEAEAAEAGAGAAERARAATEAADEIAKSAFAVGAPAAAEVDGSSAAGLGSATGVLALAQKLHDEYVSEGEDTRERLISEGQSRHDQVVGEATARQEELLSTGQARYEELVSVGEAKHDALIAEADELIAKANAEREQIITEAREHCTGMVTEAQQTRAEVLQSLGHERGLLYSEIEELRIFERDQRAHLKSYLEGELSKLEQSGSNETNAAETTLEQTIAAETKLEQTSVDETGW